MNQDLEGILAAWDLHNWLAVGSRDVEAPGRNLAENISYEGIGQEEEVCGV